MRFQSLELEGVLRVEADRLADDRGWFARLHCEREFEGLGLPSRMVQSSISFSRRKGTLRGMHLQWPPSLEGKLVRCMRGAIHDVVIDLRPDSRSYAKHLVIELTEGNRQAVYIPPGLAHGFQTLSDDVEVLYQMTDFYEPALATGVRWNDSAFALEWPLPVSSINERDAAYPDFDPVGFADEVRRRRGGS